MSHQPQKTLYKAPYLVLKLAVLIADASIDLRYGFMHVHKFNQIIQLAYSVNKHYVESYFGRRLYQRHRP
jgi:hypothetical protein